MAKKKVKDVNGHESRQVRYAVVGLGYIAQSAVLPAFANAKKNSKVTALVSDDFRKLSELGAKYEVPERNRCGYDDYERLLESGAVDAVYIALPNSHHAEFTIRAARCGVHVLCEKPLAVTVQECERMIETAERNGVKLMTSYRLHFDPANLKAVEIAQSGRLGDLRYFQSVFSMSVKAGDIRLRYALGGGTLYDIGIYCINAARYLFRDEPIAVSALCANSGDPRFEEVDETTGATLVFPGGRVASFTTSFGSADTAHYRLVGTRGDLALESAYEIAEAMRLVVTLDGKKFTTNFARHDQFAPVLMHFSDCILNDKYPEPSGEEGLADVGIIQALYASAERGSVVRLRGNPAPPSRPSPDQAMKRPKIKKPELIGASSPSKE